jgi:hypothetical protein
VVEPDFKKRWLAFKDAWERRTQNHLSIDDELVFMKFHFHFLERKEKRAIAAGNVEKDALQVTDGEDNLQALLASEGVGHLNFPRRGRSRQAVQRRKKEQAEEVIDDSDIRQPKRLSSKLLFLLVKYGDKNWTFPKANRVHGQPMREALKRLADRQLGDLQPYIVGACPFAYRKLRSPINAPHRVEGIDGRKVFYYRARAMPSITGFALPEDSPVADWAWCCRDELPLFLSPGEWHTVRDSLPLDCVA